MSQAYKLISVALVSCLFAGAAVYIWQQKNVATDVVNESPNSYELVAQYNCEKSSGIFQDHRCECPLELGQTQEMMYDTSTGYCQSSHGGPNGDAFAAYTGLPYGSYAFWANVVRNNCEESGGRWNTAAHCACQNGMTYDTSSGSCVKE